MAMFLRTLSCRQGPRGRDSLRIVDRPIRDNFPGAIGSLCLSNIRKINYPKNAAAHTRNHYVSRRTSVYNPSHTMGNIQGVCDKESLDNSGRSWPLIFVRKHRLAVRQNKLWLAAIAVALLAGQPEKFPYCFLYLARRKAASAKSPWGRVKASAANPDFSSHYGKKPPFMA